jgi:hypothetical protein
MHPHRSVSATRQERARALNGDELIPEPVGVLTHAITISCPRREVWPWLVQMGAGTRAGWYSYDRIDNEGRRSAERIVGELQSIAIGTLFPALPGTIDGFTAVRCEPDSSLVLAWTPAPGAAPIVTWAFVLEQLDQRHTRLIVRARGARGYPFCGLPPWIGGLLIRFGHFVMERRQLLGIAARAESLRSTADDGIQRDAA